jgi:MFS family permease
MLIVSQSVPMRQRPLCTGIVTALYAVAGVAGPLLGGALTDYVSWRWCFYINLPLGGVTLVFILFLFKAQKAVKETVGFKDQLSKLDPIGLVLFLPSVICLLLALQWGGSAYPWRDARVIALFVIFGVLLLLFIAVQWWQGDQATIPPRLIKNRNIWGSSLYTFCLVGGFMVFTYFVSLHCHSPQICTNKAVRIQIPIWFQSIKGVSATKSGILNLPMLVGVAVCSVLAGGTVTTFGQYMPFMYFAPVATAIAAGLLSTLEVDSGHAKYLGYQALYGIGFGSGMTQPMMAVQAALSPTDRPSGTVIVIFMQTMGGAIFISVAQNMFHNKLLHNLIKDVPQINAIDVLSAGATSLGRVVPKDLLPAVLEAYSSAITYSFYVAVALSALAILGALPMQWLSLKKQTPGQAAH